MKSEMAQRLSESDPPIAVFYRSIPKTIAILLFWAALSTLGLIIVLGCTVNFAASDATAADCAEHAAEIVVAPQPAVLFVRQTGQSSVVGQLAAVAGDGFD